MKYLILIYSNPESRAIWDSFTPEDRVAGIAVYQQLDEELIASGEMVVSEPLADPSTAKRVAVVDGRPLTTDGPFAEVKEYVVGFFLVDCASEERAVEIAAKVPEAEFGLIEVRPVVDLASMAG